MAKEKQYKIANISMDEEDYKKFVSLTKQEQLDKVYNGLEPRNMEQAELALKNVANGGDIDKGISKANESDAAKDRNGNGPNNTEKSKPNKS